MTKLLGFDPENPMVKTEISMIMSMGSSRTQGSPDEYAEAVLRFEPQSPLTRLSPAQFRELVSPATTATDWPLPLRATLLSLGAVTILVLYLN